MNLLADISSFLIFLPTLLGLFLLKKLNKEIQLLVYYLIFFGIVEIIMDILGRFKINNLFLMHLLLPVELTMLGNVFQLHFQNWLPRRLILAGLIGFTALSILNTMFLQPLNIFPSYARYAESIMLILLSLAYFYQVFTELKVEKLWEEGMFWFSTGLLIYYSGTMILYLSSNYLNRVIPQSFFVIYILILSVCHLAMYSLFTLAIWKGQKK